MDHQLEPLDPYGKRWRCRDCEHEAAAAVDTALTDDDWSEVVRIVRRYADLVAWPHSGFDPAVPIRELADKVEAAR